MTSWPLVCKQNEPSFSSAVRDKWSTNASYPSGCSSPPQSLTVEGKPTVHLNLLYTHTYCIPQPTVHAGPPQCFSQARIKFSKTPRSLSRRRLTLRPEPLHTSGKRLTFIEKTSHSSSIIMRTTPSSKSRTCQRAFSTAFPRRVETKKSSRFVRLHNPRRYESLFKMSAVCMTNP